MKYRAPAQDIVTFLCHSHRSAAIAVPLAAGTIKILVGLIPLAPIPDRVQPLVPRQFVLAPVEVSVAN
jgi:hypothetical protein